MYLPTLARKFKLRPFRIKLIAKKAIEHGKIAGIHNGSTAYAKEMIKIGYKFVTILSDFRVMSSNSQEIVNEMKNKSNDSKNSSTY